MSTEPSPKRIKVDILAQESREMTASSTQAEPTVGLRRSLRSHTRTKTEADSNTQRTETPISTLSATTSSDGKSSIGKQPSKQHMSVVWSTDHLLHNKKSKLIHANFSSLISPQSWVLLQDNEREKLLKLLPEADLEEANEESFISDLEVSDDAFIANLFKTLNNDAFRTCVSDLQDDLALGYWDKGFIRDAQHAFELRVGKMSSAIDKHKDSLFENYWGQKQAIANGKAGDTANVTLSSLCRKRLFSIGDVFQYRRAFVKGPIVEKDITLTRVELDTTDGRRSACTIFFKIPPGTRKYSENSTIDREIAVSSLNQLESLILDEDGRAKATFGDKIRNQNAWKAFRVYRGNEYVGSTFEIRQRSLLS